MWSLSKMSTMFLVLELSEGEWAHLDDFCFLVEIAVLDLPAFRHKHSPPTTLFDFGPLDQMPPCVAVLLFKSPWYYMM